MINRKRLRKLAETLENVNPRSFDLSSWTSIQENDTVITKSKIEEFVSKLRKAAKGEHQCGTTGCACGYLPAAFPKTWTLNKFGLPKLQERSHNSWEKDVIKYLGIDSDTFTYLFYPSSYHPSKRGPKSVAARIRKLVERSGYVPKEYKTYY